MRCAGLVGGEDEDGTEGQGDAEEPLEDGAGRVAEATPGQVADPRKRLLLTVERDDWARPQDGHDEADLCQPPIGSSPQPGTRFSHYRRFSSKVY